METVSRFLQVRVKVTQLCPTLCNFTDCSPPGSSVHGILQGLNLGLLQHKQILYQLSHQGSHIKVIVKVLKFWQTIV